MASTGITALPHETLGEIFGVCASVCANAPIVLASVSQSFRRVVHTTACVWWTLKLSNTRYAVNKAQLWFEKSKSCLLDVHLDLSQTTPVDDASQDVSSRPLIRLIRSHASRISSLDLRSDRRSEVHDVLWTIYPDFPAPNSTPALECLRIWRDSHVSHHPSSPRFNLPSFPHLKSLELTNHALPVLDACHFPNLETLIIRRPLHAPSLCVDDIAQVLRAGVALIRLEIETRISNVQCFSQMGSIPLLQLKHLSLRSNHVRRVLRPLFAPALRTLHLDDLDGKRAGASGETRDDILAMLRNVDVGSGEIRIRGVDMIEFLGVEGRNHYGEYLWEWGQVHPTGMSDETGLKAPDARPLDLLRPAAVNCTLPMLTCVNSSVETATSCNHAEVYVLAESAARGGFGFGSPFDRARKAVQRETEPL